MCLCIIILGVVVMAARKLWNYYSKTISIIYELLWFCTKYPYYSFLGKDSVLREVAKMKAKYNVSELFNICLMYLKPVNNHPYMTLVFFFLSEGILGGCGWLAKCCCCFPQQEFRRSALLMIQVCASLPSDHLN